MSAYDCELAVVGAGPAGMAAAISAAENGVRVAVFDQQSCPGGQIYRDLERSPLADAALLGGDYTRGRELVERFRRTGLDYFPSTRVWHLEAGLLGVIADGQTREIRADAILLATGAQERPMPFPGWQLPGVMAAGAAQVLLKSAALVPARPPLLAGSGPLLWLLAWQYLRAGVGLRAIVETRLPGNSGATLLQLPRALLAGDYLLKGLQLIAATRRAGIPWYRRASALVASGESRLQALEFDTPSGRQRIETETLLLHQGVIPASNIADAAGCRIDWSEAQQSWQVDVDRWGETSVAAIYAAGDGAAIGGARVAALSGQLAGLQVACRQGALSSARRDALARPLRRALTRQLAVRPFLDAYYRIGDDHLVPQDSTLVCRCEEISVAEIRAVAARGCPGPNQAKAFTRCGMGPCQGRMCGFTVEQIFARERGVSVAETGRYRARPPLQPLTLGQLAAGVGE